MAPASRRHTASIIALATAAAFGVAGAPTAVPALAAPVADPIVNQAAPQLTAPADDKTTPVKDVVLQWTKVPYATTYEVQISPNGDWTNNKIDLPKNGMTVATTYEVPLSLPHDEYYWRVRGVDANGHTAWSAERQFLHDWAVPLPILHTPTSADPTITWAPVAEASLYRIRFSLDPTFPPAQDVTKVCWTAGTSFTPYNLISADAEKITPDDCFTPFDPEAGKTYYYEVVAYDDSTASPIKADNAPDTAFECGTAQPECDALSVGAAGALVWQPVAAGANPTAATVSGLSTMWHASSLPGSACDVDAACPTTPTFSWTAVPGANYYRVQVFRDPYGTNVYRVYSTEWPSLTPREAYQDAQAGHAYYWNVVAYNCVTPAPSATPTPSASPSASPSPSPSPSPTTDPTTCPGTDSDGKTFMGISTIASFAKRSDAPVLRSPAAGATVKTPTVTFKWDDYLNSGNAGSLEARNYHLQISTTKTFDKPVTDIDTVDMTRWTDPTATLPDGVYYWRVQALDESSNQLTWSAPRVFTFAGAAPTFRITSKDGLGVTRNVHVKASEPDIVGKVSSSTLKVFAVSTKQAVAGTWNKAGAASWTFNPSGVLVPGESYALSVRGLRDQNGNAAVASSRTVRTKTLVDDRNPAMHYTSSWSRTSSSNAVNGSYSLGTGGSAAVTVVGDKISLYGCKGPGLGAAVVKVDGNRQATVHENQQFTECGVLLWKGSVSSSKPHQLRFVQSKGSVAFDAVKVG